MLAFQRLLNDFPRLPPDDLPAGGGDLASAPASDGSQQPPSRPEWVPESAWDAQAGLKLDELGKTYGELAQFKAQADERAKAVPEKPEGYKLELPQDFKIEGLPEGAKIAFDEKDPRLASARQLAREVGLDQAAFSRLLTIEAQRVAQDAIDADAHIQSEHKKLGDKATDRITAVDSYLKSNLPQAQATALRAVADSADAIAAIETLIAKANSGGIPRTPETTQQPPQPTVAERWYSGTTPKQRTS